jgi:hypothetical protein
MVAELRKMIPSLQQLNEEAMSLLERIEGEGEVLSSETRSSAQDLCLHREILRGIDDLASDTDAACMRMEKGLIRKLSRGGLQRQSMEALEQRYTMQRERDVHHSMWGLPNTEECRDLDESEPDHQETEGMKQEEDLGENVELF